MDYVLLLLLPPLAATLDPTARSCRINIQHTLHSHGPLVIPIDFSGTAFHLQMHTRSGWVNIMFCWSNLCHKLTSNTTANIRLRDGKLELSKASAGYYRAQNSLDNTCLMLIELQGPFLTHAPSPEAPTSMGWADPLLYIVITGVIAIIITGSACAARIRQKLKRISSRIWKGVQRWGPPGQSLERKYFCLTVSPTEPNKLFLSPFTKIQTGFLQKWVFKKSCAREEDKSDLVLSLPEH